MAYEVYNVRVKTLDNQDAGSARLYFGLNHARGAGYYYSSLGITDIQTRFRLDTGVTMDLNGLFAFSAQDPVNIPMNSGWQIYCSNFITHLFGLPAHNVALRYIFKNGSQIIVGPVEFNSSENQYYCSLQYMTARGAVVLNGGLTVRAFIPYGDYYRNCTLNSMPWKGFASSTSQYSFTSLRVTGNANQNFVSIDIMQNPVSKALAEEFFNGLEPDDADDPYPDVPDSEPDDPDDPDGIPTPDPVPIPPDPDLDVSDVGFVTLFAPTKQQLKNLASYMWSGAFDLDSFRKIFADPMDCILGLNILPCQVLSSGTAAVTVGNISTGVVMNVAASQWVTIDCGSVDIGKVYDTYLDYAPYTKTHIYLPFIGIQDLNTDDVAHKNLHLKYRIDVLSCACIAYLLVDDKVLYQFAGSCGYSVPITSSNFTALYQSIVDIGVSAAMLAVTVGTAGAGAPAAGTAAAARAEASATRMVAAQQANLASSSASAVTSAKPVVKRSGALGGGSGFLGVQKPYILVEIPRLCKPARQPHHVGYPSFVTIQVSGLSGLGIFESIILDGVPCTEEERGMLQELFMGGVYV